MTERKSLNEIQAEVEEQERKHDQLLRTLTIPVEVEWEGHTYSNRRQEAQWVKSKSEPGSTWPSVTGTSGWTAGCPQEVWDLLEVGDPYVVENFGFNRIAGFCVNGTWYGHKTDQDIKREDDEWHAKMRAEREEYVAKHREEWTQQEAELPDWAKHLMKVNRESSEDFEAEPMGWGYVLIAVRLAVLYAAEGDWVKNAEKMRDYKDEPEHIRTFMTENGMSGNQVGWAFWAANRHLNGE